MVTRRRTNAQGNVQGKTSHAQDLEDLKNEYEAIVSSEGRPEPDDNEEQHECHEDS